MNNGRSNVLQRRARGQQTMHGNLGRGTNVRRLLIVQRPFRDVQQPFRRTGILKQVAHLETFKQNEFTLAMTLLCIRTSINSRISPSSVAPRALADRCRARNSWAHDPVDLGAAATPRRPSAPHSPEHAANGREFPSKYWGPAEFGRQT